MWRISRTVTSLGAFLLTLALAVPGTSGKGTRLEQGQKLFNQGDVEGALKQLDLAAQEEREPAALEKVQLLRGQCFSARQDFVRAEDAFAAALEQNPDASLDPARVDPTVVKLLDAVRARLTATLIVNSSPPGASLFLDTKNAGVTPQTLQAPIGKHRLEARWGEGPMTPVELVLKPKKEVRVEFVQGQAPPPVLVPVAPEERPVKPVADFRGVLEVPTNGALSAGAVDLGGGVEFSYFRATLHTRLAPNFGVLVRLAGVLPIIANRLNGFIELHVPLVFRAPGGSCGNLCYGIGLGGGLGVEYLITPWLGVFGQFGGQYLIINSNRADNGTLVFSAGSRFRLP